MEAILYTKGKDLIIRTGYDADNKRYQTEFEYPDGKKVTVDTFNSAFSILETHDFWCKFTGIIEGKFTPKQVSKYQPPHSLVAV